MSWSLEDQRRKHRSDQPAARFLLGQVDGGDPSQSMLIMRLSHAQFDGDCLDRLISDLFRAFREKHIVIDANFGDFSRRAFRQLQRSPVKAFWQELLQGTTQPPLPISSVAPQGADIQSLLVTGRVSLPQLPPAGITMATVSKAAWSFVVRKRMGISTVVLTQVINGRDSIATAGTEPVFGACHSITPLCDRYGADPSKQSIRQLLQDLQKQYVQSLPYSAIDWEYIVNNCTSWPEKAQIGFMMSYQDMPFPEVRSDDVHLRTGWECSGTILPGEAWVITRPEGDLVVELYVSTTVMAHEEADAWLSDFDQVLKSFLGSPDALLE